MRYGVYKRCFTVDETTNIIKTFQKYFKANHIETADFIGISENHVGYMWFKKIVFEKIKKVIGECNLVFSAYSDASKNFQPHTDSYHHAVHNLPGTPYYSFLIPYSVDYDISKCHLAGTTFYSGTDKKHLIPEHTQMWECGDLIYWETECYHDAAEYNGYKRKQCIIGHTYVTANT